MAFEANKEAIASDEAFLAKIRIIIVFLCRCEPVHTYISGSRCAWLVRLPLLL